KIWGAGILRVAKRAKVLLFPGMLFEEMGFSYFGPIDGHDINQLVDVLTHIKELKGPILVHCVTKKGKGYPMAEQFPVTYHGLGKFDLETGKPAAAAPAPPQYTQVFGQALVELAEKDSRIVAITAAMPEGTGTDQFRDKFPRRYFDVGLAEQHAVTFAAGLACEGLKPVVAIYSSFLQRGYDQIEHDVCLQKLPVVFAIDRGGLVGDDGPTHHGAFDFAYLRMIPNITIMAPADENELRNMLKTAVEHDGPIALRYPRGNSIGVAMDPEPRTIPIGKGVRLRKGSHATILAIGNRVHPALEAAQLLEKEYGLSVGVVNMRFVKPLDTALLMEVAAETPRLITVEDHVLEGGFGSAVLEALSTPGSPGGAGSNGAGFGRCQVLRLGHAGFTESGALDKLYDLVGLTPQKIAERAGDWLDPRRLQAPEREAVKAD
ncbi:MAG: 1-deoxy-D-xylulose-5-phosphate synthase, partial [Elusimicrobia bacterium]|nr:1-deoxy-D-xylulose-5-phosphate synthase [Elusimicrobiota bacterium]